MNSQLKRLLCSSWWLFPYNPWLSGFSPEHTCFHGAASAGVHTAHPDSCPFHTSSGKFVAGCGAPSLQDSVQRRGLCSESHGGGGVLPLPSLPSFLHIDNELITMTAVGWTVPSPRHEGRFPRIWSVHQHLGRRPKGHYIRHLTFKWILYVLHVQFWLSSCQKIAAVSITQKTSEECFSNEVERGLVVQTRWGHLDDHCLTDVCHSSKTASAPFSVDLVYLVKTCLSRNHFTSGDGDKRLPSLEWLLLARHHANLITCLLLDNFYEHSAVRLVFKSSPV